MAIALSALTAGSAILISSQPAEAHRRGGAIVGGLIAGALIGGAIYGARRHYYRPYYDRPSYAYGSTYGYAPRWRYRHHHHHHYWRR